MNVKPMIKMKQLILVVLCLVFFQDAFAQKKKEKSKEQIKIENQAQNLVATGSSAIGNDNFVGGEVDYRKAIALVPSEEVAKYNLGNAYYNKSKNEEAMRRFQQAAQVATSKPEKHKAFHNLGNTFMNAKDYQNAVEAYKNALRNNPTDDETRYNLALAKELLEKNPPQGGDGEDENENQDQDNKDQDNENKDQDQQDQNKDSDNKDGENEDNKDQGDQEKDQKDGEDEGENEKPQNPNEQEKGDDPKEQKQQPVPRSNESAANQEFVRGHEQ